MPALIGNITQHGLAGFSQVIYGDFSVKAGGPDVTAPTVSSVTLAANGLSATIVLSEACTIGAGGSGGLTLVATGGNAALTYASGDTTDTFVFTSARALSSTETATLTYVQPGSGIVDTATNALASFSAQAVTNSSTANDAPTDISLSGSTVYTNAGTDAPVGTLSVTDPDAGDTATFALVVGTGDTDNAEFAIDGNTLTCNDASALGAGSRSVRIQATDSAENTYEEAFTITVALPANVAVLSGRLQISTGIHI